VVVTSTRRTGRFRFIGTKDWKLELPEYDNPETLYFTRYRLIETPWFGVFLHKFEGPDPRPTLHDHPWNSLSITLRGGFSERVPVDQIVPIVELDCYSGDYVPTTELRVSRIKYRSCYYLHSIRRLMRVPTWTLFFVGRRQRTWGYMDDNGTWTPFNEHRHNDEHAEALRKRAELTEMWNDAS
jgi:hypothetical protein